MSTASPIPLRSSRPLDWPVARGRLAAVLTGALIAAGGAAAEPASADVAESACAPGFVRASGAPDTTLFAPEASRGIRAEWCERYDATGRSRRAGSYVERYPSGAPRTEARYVDGRLDGPVVVRGEDGAVFLRGRLAGGAWTGAFSLHHADGSPWLEAEYEGGRLEGPLLLRHPDGALAAESHYACGREHGLARSFYPTTHGGGLLSEVRVDGNRVAGEHRLFDDEGTLLAPLAPDHPLFATVEHGEARRPQPPVPTAMPSPVASITTR